MSLYNTAITYHDKCPCCNSGQVRLIFDIPKLIEFGTRFYVCMVCNNKYETTEIVTKQSSQPSSETAN